MHHHFDFYFFVCFKFSSSRNHIAYFTIIAWRNSYCNWWRSHFLDILFQFFVHNNHGNVKKNTYIQNERNVMRRPFRHIWEMYANSFLSWDLFFLLFSFVYWFTKSKRKWNRFLWMDFFLSISLYFIVKIKKNSHNLMVPLICISFPLSNTSSRLCETSCWSDNIAIAFTFLCFIFFIFLDSIHCYYKITVPKLSSHEQMYTCPA